MITGWSSVALDGLEWIGLNWRAVVPLHNAKFTNGLINQFVEMPKVMKFLGDGPHGMSRTAVDAFTVEDLIQYYKCIVELDNDPDNKDRRMTSGRRYFDARRQLEHGSFTPAEFGENTVPWLGKEIHWIPECQIKMSEYFAEIIDLSSKVQKQERALERD
ncbi:hypothetical protein [Zooshikella sp. RANM57]|uniref:hypothetical protein n=1 Tax=Zooshikella sp. RANM57 TaxID=3425863 RepID=UPI003D6ECF2E